MALSRLDATFIKKQLVVLKILTSNESYEFGIFNDLLVHINKYIKTLPIEQYTPKDNSFMQCLDDRGSNHMLAGTQFTPRRVSLKVLIQPFQMETNFGEGCYIHTFIIGLDETTGLRHLVLYYET